MIRLDLFSVPLFVIDGFITEKERLSILSYIKRNPKIFKKIGNVEGVGYGNFKITHQKTTNFNFFPEGGNILEYFTKNIPECFDLKNKAQNVANKLCHFFGYKKADLTNSWITIQQNKSSLLRHNHTTSKLSAVLYLNVGDKASEVCFYNPNPFVSICDYEIQNHTNFHYYKIPPKNNTLIVFPGWMDHSSGPEPNKFVNRVALSFNTK